MGGGRQSSGKRVIIAGGGPAGSSAAVRLARLGYAVTLLEKDRFPREKLCGEFISPECFRHFEELGVGTELSAEGGDRVTETRFFSEKGRSVAVPTEWFGSGAAALSLSRARMDDALMRAARRAGVETIEGARVLPVRPVGDALASIAVRTESGEKLELEADIFVDATGRSAILAKAAPDDDARAAGLVGFKAHLSGVAPQPGVCEIYFFRGGYGGLSHVEDGKANFCFIVTSRLAKRFIGNTNRLFGAILENNSRAGQRMASAVPLHDWLAVAVNDMGFKPRPRVKNVFAVGDAGAFIDPFTGSGMLMALESSEILARCMANPATAADEYQKRHLAHFRSRLRVAGILRRAAFVPRAASFAIFAASCSGTLRRTLARMTRPGGVSPANTPDL